LSRIKRRLPRRPRSGFTLLAAAGAGVFGLREYPQALVRGAGQGAHRRHIRKWAVSGDTVNWRGGSPGCCCGCRGRCCCDWPHARSARCCSTPPHGSPGSSLFGPWPKIVRSMTQAITRQVPHGFQRTDQEDSACPRDGHAQASWPWNESALPCRSTQPDSLSLA